MQTVRTIQCCAHLCPQLPIVWPPSIIFICSTAVVLGSAEGHLTSHPSYSLWWHDVVWSSGKPAQQDIWIFLETFEAEVEVWVNKRLLWYGWVLSLFQKYVLAMARTGSADSTCHAQYIENILDTISQPAQMYSLHYTLYRHPQSSQHSGVDIAYWYLS